jgi:hypothetical protein
VRDEDVAATRSSHSSVLRADLILKSSVGSCWYPLLLNTPDSFSISFQFNVNTNLLGDTGGMSMVTIN